MKKALSPALQKLIADYRGKLPGKLEDIRQLHISGAIADPAALEAYYTAVHQLAGSSGSYGFPAVSEAARKLDRYLADVRAGEQTYSAATAASELEAIAASITATADSP